MDCPNASKGMSLEGKEHLKCETAVYYLAFSGTFENCSQNDSLTSLEIMESRALIDQGFDILLGQMAVCVLLITSEYENNLF